MHNDKRRLIKHALLLGAISLLPFSLIGEAQAAETVKVGIIHSLTGTMAISEASVVDATPKSSPSKRSTPVAG
ncbi:Extracellular ligand-binding receptor [Pseudomonas amygdali pv. mori]|uniref:Extracellular ligand-binding receptor n=1 Tax=Pseudomonas amygdali pv. mori TaxID=34065 RepID=A0A3M5J2L8_PSEA0|nr:Extracellular ligand-binding receptor [Pseudomonas amygdali pv. mori]